MAALFTIEQVKSAVAHVLLTGSTASLASGSNAISAAIDFTQTGTTAGYKRGRFVFSGTFAAAPAVNSTIALYTEMSTDGTTSNFETDLGRATNPVREPLATIALDTSNTSQIRVSAAVDLPAIPAKIIAVNSGSGQTISAGWFVDLIPETDAGF